MRGEIIVDESILNTVKKLLGLDPSYDAFDVDVTIGINAALFTLMQLGVGRSDGFVVTSSVQTWSEFVGESTDLEALKQYVYLRTRIAFDPPTNSSVLQSMKDLCAEYEWRLNVQVDPRT